MTDSGETNKADAGGSRSGAKLAAAGLLLLAAALAGAGVYLSRQHAEDPSAGDKKEKTKAPPVVAARTYDLRRAKYLGPESCRECHKERTESFVHTDHFKTSALPTPETLMGDHLKGRNVLRTRNPALQFEIEQRGDKFYFSAVGVDPKTKEPKRRIEEIAYVVGSGKISNAYLYWRGDGLFQLPAGHLQAVKGLANCPGYRDGQAYFDRAVIGRCLDCHATYVRHQPGTLNTYSGEGAILGVTCERCHGPASEHAAYHRAFPGEEKGKHIVSPESLTRTQRLDQCAVCHGNAEDLAAEPFTYMPGDPVEAYVKTAPGSAKKAATFVHTANQIQRLRQSKCFQGSERLECITCHDPHVASKAQKVPAGGQCVSCHQPDHCRMGPKIPEPVRGDCVSCHMPGRKANETVFHTASDDYVQYLEMTEHRIGIYDDATRRAQMEWYDKQPGSPERMRAVELRAELVAGLRSQAKEYHAKREFLAEIGAWRELLAEMPRDEEATVAMAEAIETQHRLDFARELTDLALRQTEAGKVEDAIASYRKAIELDPTQWEAYNNLGVILAAHNQIDEALKLYRKALEHDPGNTLAHNNLGLALARKGELDDAIREFRTAAEAGHVEAICNLGNALLSLRRVDEALAQYRKAIEKDPTSLMAHNNLALVLEERGDWAGAVTHLRELSKNAPQDFAVMDRLAWILATAPEAGARNGEEALMLARRVVYNVHPEKASYRDTLGAAYAEVGNFESAAAQVKGALALAAKEENMDPMYLAQLRKRLELYEKGMPYRQEPKKPPAPPEAKTQP